MRAFAFLVALLLVARAAFADATSPFTSERWGFRAEFPAPVRDVSEATVGLFGCEVANGAYFVSAADVPNGLRGRSPAEIAALREAELRAIARRTAEVVRDEVVADPYPGRAFELRGPKVRIRARIYVVAGRVYTVYVLESTQKSARPAAEFEAFLGSFAVLVSSS